ncbi:MAG TPA: cobyrinic acid a,c-diamide synthase [Rhodocyclaceae bacterium]|nr:MAG: cobyrinic acid a,c-diamide synthase [Betaproteobacteria bacterium CG2_30_68_42]PIX74507.1 MAG: cobyrinic acid a,c-diamide synthase [Rhodocyclales bacterium CG_4_10_14_3_um_filter_68_10]HCX34825.1 cobyrinic acid a,c-diamide synthase [Rhodocyclaceae bacterium]
MLSILVANAKGGSGKTTLATNLAGCFARRGEQVMLGDTDRQQSSRAWLGLRPDVLPAIRGWEIAPDAPARPPHGTTHVVLDSPAGLHGHRLRELVRIVDRILVPLQPSLFDMLATRAFLEVLMEEKPLRRGRARVGVVGMRVDERTRAARELERFLDAFGMPVVGYLRDTQLYVQVAAHGLTVFDLSPGRAGREIEQWRPILDWLGAQPDSPV